MAISSVLTEHDVAHDREAARRRRVVRLAAVVIVAEVWVVTREVLGLPIMVDLPAFDPLLWLPVLFFVALIGVMVAMQVGSGRSPHVTYRPEQVDVRLTDVIGIDPIIEDVQRSLDVFWAHRSFANQMGGRPRRGLLFEGAPGTGKTLTAKAMAAEAGVPFLFVSATAFQSMYYGATARKIRAYFRALRRAAQAEGGAIGFIEEIDAIALRRGLVSSSSGWRLPGVSSTVIRQESIAEGTGGVVNELLVQMQSFDEPIGTDKLVNAMRSLINLFLPADRQLRMRRPGTAPVLLIAATNRADALDPALLRPGRFDRRLTFQEPDVHGRRALLDYFLTSRSHEPELDSPSVRDRVAASTTGWTPVMIEHLLDEALINALRRGANTMTYPDVERARVTQMVGLGHPVTYSRVEQEIIATHEAGHAVTAHLVAPQRILEVLTIVRHGSSLGLLAHDDAEDVYTRSRSELNGLIQISLGGWCAEEMFFGETTTGPASDLVSATRIGAQMVGAAGMTGSLVSLTASGKDVVEAVTSDNAARAQLENILNQARDQVRELLRENRDLVEALRDALLDRHELIGPEITEILYLTVASRQPASV